MLVFEIRLDSHDREVTTDYVDRALWPRAQGMSACMTPGCECRDINPNPNPSIMGGLEDPARHGLTVEDYTPEE